jgi:cytoskeleton protein RodZ
MVDEIRQHQDQGQDEGQENECSQIAVGQLLAEQREKQGMTLHECADVLKIPLLKLDALEKGNVETLGSEVFLRGYIKSYAKLLQLSADDLLVQYDEKKDEKEESVEDTLTTKKTSSVHGWWIPYAICIAVIVLWFLVSAYMSEDDSPVVEVPPEAEKSAAVANTEASPVAELSAPSESDVNSLPAIEVVSQEASTASEEVVNESEVAIEPVVESVAEPPVANTPVANNSAGGGGRIYFTFLEECWVEITDASGQIIFSDLRKANTDLWVDGEAPFSIILGNASGVSVFYDGQPVPISARTDTGTSRLTLGG